MVLCALAAVFMEQEEKESLVQRWSQHLAQSNDMGLDHGRGYQEIISEPKFRLAVTIAHVNEAGLP